LVAAGAVVGGVVGGADVVGGSDVGGSLVGGSLAGGSLVGAIVPVGALLGAVGGSSLGGALSEALGDPDGHCRWWRPSRSLPYQCWPDDERIPFSFAAALSLRVGSQNATVSPAAARATIISTRGRRAADLSAAAER
jgi:phage tail tape-measure protein